jgi:hypothetical protein
MDLPSGFLTTEKTLSKKQIENLRIEWSKIAEPEDGQKNPA